MAAYFSRWFPRAGASHRSWSVHLVELSAPPDSKFAPPSLGQIGAFDTDVTEALRCLLSLSGVWQDSMAHAAAHDCHLHRPPTDALGAARSGLPCHVRGVLQRHDARAVPD